MIKLTEILQDILTEKKLCKKGKAYYDRRRAAGEKPSAYLSGRAVKVCKGLMEEDDLNEMKINIPHNYINSYYSQHIEKIKEKFKKPIKMLNLKIGKYNLSGNEVGVKLDWEEGKQFLSSKTKDNVYYIFDSFLGIDPDYVYIGIAAPVGISPEENEKVIQQGIDIGHPRLSYYIVGKIEINGVEEPVAIARKETSSPMAGQTYLVTPNVKKRLSKFDTPEFPATSLFPTTNIDESLRDWFKKEDWVRIDTAGNITGPCGTMKKGNKTTRCLPRAKANSLTKAERAATSKKKAASNKQFVPNTKKAKVRLKK
jgi:hypothetical protein